MSRSLFISASALATLTLAVACGQLPPESTAPATPESVSPDGVQHVTVLVSNESRFAPSHLVVKAGRPVDLTLRSIGLVSHDFTLREGTSEPVHIVVDAGRSASARFTLARPGTYAFLCTVPGHDEAGMHGTITAEAE
jgi:uncharacterized cupredoxin-like copper-binding protein